MHLPAPVIRWSVAEANVGQRFPAAWLLWEAVWLGQTWREDRAPRGRYEPHLDRDVILSIEP